VNLVTVRYGSENPDVSILEATMRRMLVAGGASLGLHILRITYFAVLPG